MSIQKLKITLVSNNSDIIKETADVFPPDLYPNIIPVYCNISQCTSHDCIVSPANSFGHMDGGIDRTLSYILMKDYDENYIGRRVREVIKEKYSGEQPVGTCILIETHSSKFPYLAHAPTMTVPTNVVRTLNSYYAFKAVLEEIQMYNQQCIAQDREQFMIKSVLTTTFCTGCGEMSIHNSLIQMKKAYDIVCNPVVSTWEAAH